MINTKLKLLDKIYKLELEGIKTSEYFNVDDSYEEILAEYRLMVKKQELKLTGDIIFFSLLTISIMDEKFGIINDPEHGLLSHLSKFTHKKEISSG